MTNSHYYSNRLPNSCWFHSFSFLPFRNIIFMKVFFEMKFLIISFAIFIIIGNFRHFQVQATTKDLFTFYANQSLKFGYEIWRFTARSQLDCGVKVSSETDFGFSFDKTSLECSVFRHQWRHCVENDVILSNAFLLKPETSCSKFVFHYR